jgi:CheY-like chemotaxis protein
MLCRSILVVEDDVGIRDAMEGCLRDAGYDVIAVANGSEALRVLPKLEAPALILLDMMMPFLNGWELAEAWKAQILAENCRVVVISALEARRALARGPMLVEAQAYLRKPVDLALLLGTVEQYCGLPGEAHDQVLARESALAASAF